MHVPSSEMIMASPMLGISTFTGREIDPSVVEISNVKPAEFIAISRRDGKFINASNLWIPLNEL